MEVPEPRGLHSNRRDFGTLIDPAVWAGRRLVLVLIDVHVEPFAVALVLPIRDAVSNAVEKRSTPQINVGHQHAPKMTKVGDGIAA